ncbi:histidine kinase [Algibacter miyuki]|uniref:Histidine kinase n=1 Tax=Algibacter miyuki TaxID=1306933 RepID=A0ABV5H204_9FLAO|nr:histidine kinase [Algibacter miyuki]MDN3666539.1 histidine kinase [Algibacter miyuki]
MTKSNKYIIITFLLGCVVFLIGGYFFNDFNSGNIKELVTKFAFYQLYAFVLGYSNMMFFDYMERRSWEKSTPATIQRVVIGILGSTIITLIGLFFLRAITAIYYFNQSFSDFLGNQKWQNYQFGLWITLSIVIGFHVVFFYNRYQQNRVKEQKVIAGTASAKFDALKNQLDPHFLFNSLNVLTSLIEENPVNAQKFTTALSKVYRYVLEQKNKDLVLVDDELKFAKTYMALLKMRFEDSIIFTMPEKAQNPESKVIPLSLQLLLENAVKHNIVTASKPLKIKIYESGDNLVVENNLQVKQMVKTSSGVGLNNIKQRYQLLTDRTIKINQEPSTFAVSIPMLTKTTTIMYTQSKSELNDQYLRARNHVDELKGFYYSLITYCLVIPFLAYVNYKTFWQVQWFWFPMIGWGIGIATQAYRVFVNNGMLGKNWEKRKMEEFMRNEQTKNN